MPITSGEGIEKESVMEAARLMLISARTAPKTGGIDDIVTAIVSGDEKEAIAAEMDRIGDERNIQGFKRDANNVRNSDAVVLIGVRGTGKKADLKEIRTSGLNCGACGFDSCYEFYEQAKKKQGKEFSATCMFKALDLGIALGSAVKTASILNVDNRIMYRVGAAAMRLKCLPEASVIMGIPVSAKGKSIYFDRH